MIQLYGQVYPNEIVTEKTLIKGTTIEKLCEFQAGGYKRVIKWLEDKIAEAKQESKTDLVLAKEQMEKCLELMAQRNKSYGTSWKCLSVQSIANLIEMKMNRVAKLGEVDAKTLDEFQDCINYACFALIKINKKS